MIKYVVSHGRDMYNKHYNWCCEQKQPFIIIEPKRKYARVIIDFLPVGSHGFPDGTMERLLKPYWSDLKPNQFVAFDGVFSWVDIRKERAEEVANLFWDVANYYSSGYFDGGYITINQEPHPKGWGMLQATSPVFGKLEIIES